MSIPQPPAKTQARTTAPPHTPTPLDTPPSATAAEGRVIPQGPVPSAFRAPSPTVVPAAETPRDIPPALGTTPAHDAGPETHVPVPPPNGHAWLEHVPPEHRSATANWFHYAVRSGSSVPAAVLTAIDATIQRRLGWRHDADAWPQLVRAKLHEDRAGALAYAQTVIAYEQLPKEQRQQVKVERSHAYLKEAMRGKEATPAQLAYLKALGHAGPAPTDRAAASALIDQLRQGRADA